MENQDSRSKDTYEKAKEYWSKQPGSHAGMLGNLPMLHPEDIKSSSIFLRQLFKNKPPLGKKRALDCGAGIGRVTKYLLSEEFDKVDLLEQDEKFCEKAKENLGQSGKLGEIYNVGLQDFKDHQHSYDVIWCQWFLGHLLDEDLVQALSTLSSMLTPHGMIVVKENFTETSQIVVDEVDSSVTRPLSHFKKLFKQANLRLVKESKQQNFPAHLNLFPVYMLALKRAK